MERKYTIILSIIAIALISSLIFYSISKPKTELTLKDKEDLAKCLTQKGILLYGTINCPNCEVQKEEFDEAAQYLSYVNCYIEEEKCAKYSKQKVYPFWGMDETAIVGPIPLDKLKEKTNC